MTKSLRPTRRRVLTGAAAAAVSAPFVARLGEAAGEFRIGMFYAIAGPAAGLFGPTQKACAELAVEQVNAAGGILGKQVKLFFANGDGAVADATQSAQRLMLNEKVDFFLGSHNSAVREALVATIKGRTPYVYTPIYEGGECARHTYTIADTPQQQMETALPWIVKKHNIKSYYLIGNDYVWPQVTNKHAKRILGSAKMLGEEYAPLGAPNKFEEAVTRIKDRKPDLVLITLVGADNVNFNRTFAGFGLAKDMVRMSSLLEENTLMGIGAENSANLYGCMSYYASNPAPENAAFKAAYAKKFGEKAPQLSLLGEDCYAGIKFIEAAVKKAGASTAAKVSGAVEGLTFSTPSGSMTMRNRHVDKSMFLAECKGTTFNVVETFKNVSSGQTCA